ncbi:TonB-dependent receptor [Stakelama saccharophila]|uniref:TonB-dependent receptor n=1 Tax=Stakelama saccharophila TaxID=3075605 RepID=A0ABZ0BA84_9SPHN|nr:TonB-dependent receptor [Stakelama sp. W311]WNO54321.1 TonB-dependent receptor [Stakelama sp. W311]
MRNHLLMGAAAVALSIPAAASAQQITSGIEGSVLDDTDAALPGATVTITDTRTGSSRTVSTSDNGSFRANNLVPGGPYTVTASAPGFESKTVQGVNINLQGNTDLSFQLATGAGEIVVTGSSVNSTQLAIGPGQSFGEETLEAFPSITRDIRDYIRIDPRVSLNRSDEVDRVSCLGGNDRTNTFTVDGITQSDVFGLNYTPFASRNSLPLPFDAVRETSVEFAPFDVQYGAFTGCSINVVTKSGTNQFHGTAFFTYRDENLRGDTIDGEEFAAAPFDEKRYGASLGGPIIKDKLFFYAAYEGLDSASNQDRGPSGGGFANELDFVNVDQFNEISDIIAQNYGIETGPIPRALPETNDRYFGRIDWYINDRHRLEATYQHLEESNVEEDDISQTNYAGLNTFEEEGTKSDYFSARLYSDWTDNFSTEIRASHAEVNDIQGPVGGGEAQSGNPIPRIIVGVENNGNYGSIQAGPGYSRTSNELTTKIDQLKVKGDIDVGNHTLTIGTEFNQVHVYNLFAQNSTGTLDFANIDDLRAGLLSNGTNTFPQGEDFANYDAAGSYGNFTASGDINDVAARFTRTLFSVYAQDNWQATPHLNVLAGARLDWTDGDAPRANPAFLNRYGFTNAIGFSQLDPVVLPRLGVTYDFDNDGFFRSTQVTGGVGMFSGGDPMVYFSNAFSNNGFVTGMGTSYSDACAGARDANGQIDVLQNGQFTGIPDCVRQDGSAAAGAGLGDTQSTDPNFKTPTVIRANLGFSTTFGTGGGFFDDWHLNVDYIYSRFRNPVDFVDLSQVVNPALGNNGYMVDGRPIYRAIDPTAAGCDATLQGFGGLSPSYTNVSDACFDTTRDDEIQLTNGKDFETHVASLVLSKHFRGGLFTEGGSVSFNLGYAYTNAETNRESGSSTATSSYDYVAAFDRQNVAIARSEYETRHNITLALNLKEQFFGDYDTSAGFVFVGRSGRPYSLTFNGGGVFNDSASGSNNALLYVPTGVDDPNLGAGTDPEAVRNLIDYVANSNCDYKPGQTIKRDTCTNDWFFDVDLRFSQEIPGPAHFFGVNDKLKLFANFDNFLNLLDSSWNVYRTQSYTVDVAKTAVGDDGRYVITDFDPYDPNFVQTSSSIWKIQVGVSYEF